MLVYQSYHQPVVDALKQNNWDQSDIRSYLNYLEKKDILISSGRKHGEHSRDSDRSKVYNSEFKYERTYGQGREFKTLAAAQKYCDMVLRSPLWKKLTKDVTSIAIGTCKGHRIAGRAWRNNIDLNIMHGMTQYVLLHEMAHCAGNMHHDTQFRIDLVKLVSRFIGKEQAEYLKSCFKEKKLKLKINTNIMKPDVWIKMHNRMELARDKKTLSSLDMAA